MSFSLKGIPTPYLIAGGVALGLIVYISVRGVKGFTTDASRAVVGAAGGLATGTVLGIGDTLGIPETNMTACEKAKAEGRTWDASFDCSATDFLRWLAGGK